MNLFVKSNRIKAFTIVELLVVIVVIGILASITIVSYAGITKRASIASLESDLSNNSKVLKMYYAEHGSYPTSLDGSSNCPILPIPSTNYCIKTSPGNSLNYTGGGNSFKILLTKNGISYYVTENSVVSAVTAPVVNANTVSAITGSAATIGGTIASNGGADVTNYGVCYGLTANPTNCVAIEQGALTATTPATIATARPQIEIKATSDGLNIYSISDTGVVRMYRRNTITNILTELTPATIATGDMSGRYLIVSPDNKFIYTVSTHVSSSVDIYMFSRSEANGLLTALTPNKLYVTAGGSGATEMAISSNGMHMYVLHGNRIYYYSRDLATGLLSLINSVGVSSGNGIVMSPDNLFLYVAGVDGSNNGQIQAFSRNISNGSLAISSTFTIGNNYIPDEIIISSDGNSVYTNLPGNGTIRQFSRNSSNGQLTALTPNSITLPSSTGLSISIDDKTVYASEGGRIRMYSRDTASGLLTAFVVPFLSSPSTSDIYLTPDNKGLYSINSTNVNMYNRSYGAAEGAVFTKSITGLTAGTTYYYRSFSTNSAGTSYSADSTFVTL